MGSLPSRLGHKKAKHGLSKFVKPSSVVPPASSKQPSIQILDLDSSILAETTPSKLVETILSKPPRSIPMNLLENEGLAWERFQQAVTDEDINVCYDMSLKDFEHSVVHDLFKVYFYVFIVIIVMIIITIFLHLHT